MFNRSVNLGVEYCT